MLLHTEILWIFSPWIHLKLAYPPRQWNVAANLVRAVVGVAIVVRLCHGSQSGIERNVAIGDLDDDTCPPLRRVPTRCSLAVQTDRPRLHADISVVSVHRKDSITTCCRLYTCSVEMCLQFITLAEGGGVFTFITVLTPTTVAVVRRSSASVCVCLTVCVCVCVSVCLTAK